VLGRGAEEVSGPTVLTGVDAPADGAGWLALGPAVGAEDGTSPLAGARVGPNVHPLDWSLDAQA
jgi:hypothetical protein